MKCSRSGEDIYFPDVCCTLMLVKACLYLFLVSLGNPFRQSIRCIQSTVLLQGHGSRLSEFIFPQPPLFASLMKVLTFFLVRFYSVDDVHPYRWGRTVCVYRSSMRSYEDGGEVSPRECRRRKRKGRVAEGDTRYSFIYAGCDEGTDFFLIQYYILLSTMFINAGRLPYGTSNHTQPRGSICSSKQDVHEGTDLSFFRCLSVVHAGYTLAPHGRSC